MDELNRSYIQEVDGTGGSKMPYRGPIAEVKWQAYQKAQKDFDQNELIRANNVKLLEAEKAAKLSLISDKDAKGFLGNMKILGRLMDEDSHVRWCVWMVRMLFLCIELVPVFIKMGTSSDMDPYGTMKDMNDRNQEAVQKELVEAKSGLIKTKQLLLMQVEKYQITFEDTKAAMNSSTRTYEFFLDKIKHASEQKMKAQLNLIEKVKDETVRAVLMGQIDQAYESYIQTLEALIQKQSNFILQQSLILKLMKKLALIALTPLFSLMIYHFFKHPESLSGNKVNIESLTKNPAAYTEKPLTIGATVMEATSIMNYTKCLIGDNQGHTIWFISNKPYKKGELIEINAHLYVLFQKDEQQCAVLIEDDDFKMVKGILHYFQNP